LQRRGKPKRNQTEEEEEEAVIAAELAYSRAMGMKGVYLGSGIYQYIEQLYTGI